VHNVSLIIGRLDAGRQPTGMRMRLECSLATPEVPGFVATLLLIFFLVQWLFYRYKSFCRNLAGNAQIREWTFSGRAPLLPAIVTGERPRFSEIKIAGDAGIADSS
jgi:hypothetical protein